jgi:hypothetical protein
MALFNSNYCYLFSDKNHHNIGYQEKRQFFRHKMAKMAKMAKICSEHNIGPWTWSCMPGFETKPWLINRPHFSTLQSHFEHTTAST